MYSRLSALVLGGLTCLSAGCLVMTGSTVEESGVRISGETLACVTPGQTTEAWLLATLGEPTTRTEVEGQDGTAILKYRYCQTKAEGGVVFVLFAGGSAVESTTTTYFETVDGVVTRFWTEG